MNIDLIESVKKMGIEMGNIKLTLDDKYPNSPMRQIMLYIWSNDFYKKLVNNHFDFVLKFEKMLQSINDASKKYCKVLPNDMRDFCYVDGLEIGTDLKTCFKFLIKKNKTDKNTENVKILESFYDFLDGKEVESLNRLYNECFDKNGDVYMSIEEDLHESRFAESVKIESA